jgi:hypothetical protein
MHAYSPVRGETRLAIEKAASGYTYTPIIIPVSDWNEVANGLKRVSEIYPQCRIVSFQVLKKETIILLEECK